MPKHHEEKQVRMTHKPLYEAKLKLLSKKRIESYSNGKNIRDWLSVKQEEKSSEEFQTIVVELQEDGSLNIETNEEPKSVLPKQVELLHCRPVQYGTKKTERYTEQFR